MSKQKLFTNDDFSDKINVFKKYLSPFINTPVNFLEIGSCEGRSAVWVLSNILTHPSSRLYCVDPLDHEKIETRFRHNVQEYGDKVTLVKYKSERALLTAAVRNRSYDFIYVDGYHESKETLEDAVLCFGLLKNGGIMIFDDYLWSPKKDLNSTPKLAIDSFLNCYKKYINILQVGYCIVIQKQIK